MKSKPSSIHLRLLGANLLILPLFLGLIAYGLDRAFGSAQLASQEENMRLQQLLVAKAAEWSESGWLIEELDEPRLSLLNSGLYAFVFSPEGQIQWQSQSAQQLGELTDPAVAVSELAGSKAIFELEIGRERFSECELDEPYFCYATVVAWGSSGPSGVFLILEDQVQVIGTRESYRRYLVFLCLGLTAALVLAQLVIARWGLAPLRRITSDIDRLKRGEKHRLQGSFPRELEPLTSSINVLLDSEESRRERVRNTVDRLTHTLKTPLMLIRNTTQSGPQYRELVEEQVSRILGIVEGELARARLDGPPPEVLGKSVDVKPVLERITRAYQRLPKVGEEQASVVQVSTEGIVSDVVFPGEERDLQDLFGSILENSMKYCHSKVRVTALLERDDDGQWLVLRLGDDGDGIPAGYEHEILRRGARADTATVGQGLGLAIALEIVSAYGGSLHTDTSDLGGAEFIVKLPGARRPA